MNLRLNILSLGLLCLSILCATNCSAASALDNTQIGLLCEQAKNGTLETNQIDTSNAHINSYLFDCSVAVVIGEPNKVSGKSGSKAERDLKKSNRAKIADFFLANELDVNYRNRHGNSMLIATVISFLPVEWKEKAVAKLIAKGVTVNEKNNGGKTALDLAKLKNHANLVKVLSTSMTKPHSCIKNK
jgi:hypothetical protein